VGQKTFKGMLDSGTAGAGQRRTFIVCAQLTECATVQCIETAADSIRDADRLVLVWKQKCVLDRSVLSVSDIRRGGHHELG